MSLHPFLLGQSQQFDFGLGSHIVPAVDEMRLS